MHYLYWNKKYSSLISSRHLRSHIFSKSYKWPLDTPALDCTPSQSSRLKWYDSSEKHRNDCTKNPLDQVKTADRLPADTFSLLKAPTHSELGALPTPTAVAAYLSLWNTSLLVQAKRSVNSQLLLATFSQFEQDTTGRAVKQMDLHGHCNDYNGSSHRTVNFECTKREALLNAENNPADTATRLS